MDTWLLGGLFTQSYCAARMNFKDDYNGYHTEIPERVRKFRDPEDDGWALVNERSLFEKPL